MEELNWKEQIRENEKKILKTCPNATFDSGIYIFTRKVLHCYIGQAKNTLARLANHLSNYDRIDLSVKAHGLYSEDNPYGWKITVRECDIPSLDEMEIELIERALQNDGVLLYNKQSGGQGKGKTKIADYKPAKGYRDGLKQGYENARKLLAPLFEKWLQVEYDNNKKLAERAYNKFNDFIKGEQNNE